MAHYINFKYGYCHINDSNIWCKNLQIIPYMYFITEIIIIVGEGVAVAVWSEDQF